MSGATRRALLGGGLAFAGGAAMLAGATNGFRAVTFEGARRLAVARAPRPVPAVPCLDERGREAICFLPDGGWWVVDFIYTGCPTICRALGEDFARLQERLPEGVAGGPVRLASVSFDLARDDPEALADYARRYRADPARWRVFRPRDAAGLARLLAAFEVVVIEDGLGGFVHNAALSLVDPAARLVAVYDRPQQVLAALERNGEAPG